MNQAPSRRLRTRCLPLLLLLPLSLASAQPTADAGTPVDAGTSLPTYRLEISGFQTAPPQVGACTPVWVKLLDAQGNPATPSTPVLVSLSSNHPDTGLFYEREGCATRPVSSVYIGPSSYFRQLWFRDTRAGEVTLSASSPGAEGASHGPFRIPPGPMQQILMEPSPSTSTVPACTQVEIKLTAVDAYGNPVTEGYEVTLCRQLGTSPTFVGTDLSSSGHTVDCVRGLLSGTKYVAWRNPDREQVRFELTYAANSTPQSRYLTVTWSDPVFSSERSTLAFLGTTETEPRLQPGDQLRLQFEPRNTCHGLSRLPAGQRLSFDAEDPLNIPPPTEESDGRWTALVTLPACPPNVQELRLWPTLNDAPILIDDNEQLERKIRPLCFGVEVKVSLNPQPVEPREVVPGELLSFVVALRNTGQDPLPAGLLRVSAEGLGRPRLTLGEQTLAVLSEREGEFDYSLPSELAPGATLTLEGETVVLSNATPVKLKVGYGTKGGEKLAEGELELNRLRPEVDVGCGCHAGPLASPWLALLALASRARAQSARLRRRERIEHQAPCRQ